MSSSAKQPKREPTQVDNQVHLRGDDFETIARTTAAFIKQELVRLAVARGETVEGKRLCGGCIGTTLFNTALVLWRDDVITADTFHLVTADFVKRDLSIMAARGLLDGKELAEILGGELKEDDDVLDR